MERLVYLLYLRLPAVRSDEGFKPLAA